MAQTVHALTTKEKEALRLLLAGHDAKSAARQLGLSVYTVHERLRGARRKLEVSSSKEAARLLREAEGAAPYSIGDKGLGDALAAALPQQAARPGAGSLAIPLMAWPIGGLVMIALLSVALALTASPQAPTAAVEPSQTTPAAAPAAEPAATQAARQWLALVDAGKWPESWAATARSFQTNNSVAMWQSASEGARVPLGSVLSRRFAGQESIPAPPGGYELVRFRTDFANKAGATETLSLAREGESWRVAGYYIE